MGQEQGLVAQHHLLKTAYFIAAFCYPHLIQKIIHPQVFHREVQGGHIGQGSIHIIRIQGAVKHCGLPPFADAGADPVSLEAGLQSGDDAVMIGGCVFSRQKLPGDAIALRYGGGKEAVFHHHLVGIQQVGEFVRILWSQGIISGITFGHENDRLFRATDVYHYSLRIGAKGGIFRIQRLREIQEIAFRPTGGGG